MTCYKKLIMIVGAAILAAPIAMSQTEVVARWNPDNVILPSSQWTPNEQYTASVAVYNKGQRYSDQYYNHVFAAPSDDAAGRKWYEAEYELTDGDIRWQSATAPFSSDEYYKGKKSYRWCTVDIMGDLYMRRVFKLNEPIAEPVYLATGHDDGPSEWYINGELVYSIPEAWNNDDRYLLTDQQKSLLKTDGSDNVIAVHVHQNWGGAFADCGLYRADAYDVTTLLPTVAQEPQGWGCYYYFLNHNEDIAKAEACNWASLDEDESDWVSGVGPLSIDGEIFLKSFWPSVNRPLLVRRHFTLSADDIARLAETQVSVTCSYDENPKMYLNGTLIWSASGWNDNNYAEYTLSDEHKALLREGDNVLAVSLTSGNGGGHIDYGMTVQKPHEYSGVESVLNDSRQADNRIYNIAGVYVGTNRDALSAGVYICDGKKFLKK